MVSKEKLQNDDDQEKNKTDAAGRGESDDGVQDDLEAQYRPNDGSRATLAGSRTLLSSKPSLENRGFARAMMKQMPSKLALSASNIAHLSYGKSRSDMSMGELKEFARVSHRSVRSTPSLLRYEKDVDRLVDTIESEMEEKGQSILNEDRKIARLRELPVGLSIKRAVNAELKSNLAHKRSAEISTRVTRLSYSLGHTLVLMKRRFAEMMDAVHLWNEQLRTIDGNFGRHVGLYFRFIRWLLVANLSVFCISVVFLVFPQMLLSISDPEEAKRSAQGLEDVPSAIGNMRVPESAVFSFSNLLTGQGWFLMSPMYYGYYYRGTIDLTKVGGYYMPSAYLHITSICILIQLILLAYSTALSYKENFIEVHSNNSTTIANLILAGWDARVTAARLAALKRKGLYILLKQKVEKKEAEEQARQLRETDSMVAQRRREQVRTVVIRLAVNAVVLALLVGVSALTWLSMVVDEQMHGRDDDPVSLLASALIISATMALFPMLFQWLGSLEHLDSHHRALTFITLVRMIVMTVVIIGTIVTYWIQSVNSSDGVKAHCWENEVGSELYQLMLTDLIFMLFFETGLEFFRKISYKYGAKWLGEPTFDIPRSTTFLIYSQTLVWAGSYFSPLAYLLGCGRHFVTFYVKKWSVWYNCYPQARTVRASQTQTVFRVAAFIVCFLSATFTGYIVFNVTPSLKCGPFQGREAPWVILNDTLNGWRDQNHTALYSFVILSQRPAVVAIWILLFSVVAYYLRSLALARQEMIELLRGQLTLEGQDKVVLLQLIDDAGNRLEEVRKARQVMKPIHELREEEPIIFETPKDLHVGVESQDNPEDVTADSRGMPDAPARDANLKKDEHTERLGSAASPPVLPPSHDSSTFWSRYGNRNWQKRAGRRKK